MCADDRDAMEVSAGARLALIESSYARVTGERLVPQDESLWTMPRAVVAHGTEDPPLFFYANRAGLDLFRMGTAEFIGLHSYKSAEPDLRAERAAMLARLDEHDVVTDYTGIRIAADGTRFRIEEAVIWNLRDEAGALQGQAAAIAKWKIMWSVLRRWSRWQLTPSCGRC